MNWAEHAQSWPNAAFSRFIDTRSNRWHVQDMGKGPVIVLIHGAGGSTHSWRDVLPRLAASARVIAMDLPGQGFTQNHHKSRLSLPSMAEDIADLLREIDVQPAAIVGHSAGAAIMFQMAVTGKLADSAKLVSINGALGNFDGPAGVIFPAMAKLLSMNPLTALLFAKTATPRTVTRLIGSMGSKIDDDGMAHYGALFADRTHVDRTLAMMAQWSLDGLVDKVAKLPNDILFLAGGRDGAVPPKTSRDAADLCLQARYEEIETLGHLMHEEDPEQVARIIANYVALG